LFAFVGASCGHLCDSTAFLYSTLYAEIDGLSFGVRAKVEVGVVDVWIEATASEQCLVVTCNSISPPQSGGAFVSPISSHLISSDLISAERDGSRSTRRRDNSLHSPTTDAS